MSQISAVATDASGRLISFIEGAYTVTVRRDSAGRPLVARAVSGGKPSLQSEFRYDASMVFKGAVGDFESSVLSTLINEAIFGGASGSGGTSTAEIGTPVSASRSVTADDLEKVTPVSAASTFTIPTDATLGITDPNYAAAIGFYQASSGAVTIVAGAGVTLGGTPKPSAIDTLHGAVRVGVNKWVLPS